MAPMDNCSVGIDPGLGGALVLLRNPQDLQFWDMPTIKKVVNNRTRGEYDSYKLLEILRYLQFYKPLVVLEKVAPFPKQGVVSVSSLVGGMRLIEGMLVALGMRFVMVPPQRWKRIVGIFGVKDKRASIACAQRLFPDFAEEITNDGRADALLLAYALELKCGPPFPDS